MAGRGDELVFAPLGGVGEIGMNLAIYGFGDPHRRKWIAVDLGVSFGGDDLPGIDLIMPDIRFLVEERRNLLGLVLTHAHEDHFGALLDLWPRLKIPVYPTPFAAALIEAKRQSEPGAPESPVTILPLHERFSLFPFYISLARAAASFQREIELGGRSMARIAQVGGATGYLEDIRDFRSVEVFGYLPPEKVVALCTGSKGEARAALSRIAEDDHPEVGFSSGDRVIFSSRAIPGNEKAVMRVINGLVARGVEVITDRDHLVHVSGHPRRAC